MSQGTPEFSCYTLPATPARKVGQGPNRQLGPDRQGREQDQALPEVAWVAMETGASKNFPRDSWGGSRLGSFLIIQQHEDIKKSIYWHKESFGLMWSLYPELRAPQTSEWSRFVRANLAEVGCSEGD